MPTLNLSELNIVLGVLGAFMVLYGVISVKIKQAWYLGEALPTMVIGIILGPISAKFLDSERWGTAQEGQSEAIALGLMRVVIGIQLVIAGYQLPAKYNVARWKELFMCLIPVMTLMWLCTTGCILATVPKVSLLAAMVLASCVTCTDPVLSQAVAKGPFADKFVPRYLREIISSEAGANDGFGFPFLMLATYLMHHAFGKADHGESTVDVTHMLFARAGDVGRLGGGVGEAFKNWFLETWLYYVIMGIAYGAVVGYSSCRAVKFALKRGWIDEESYLLFPTALGLFLIGTCGAIGTNDLIACTVAGNTLNWDGDLRKPTAATTKSTHFNDPDGTGVTYPRLIALGVMVLFFRRIPAILTLYKLMPAVVKNYKDALFMGYFGPIGVGAVFYLEHVRHLFPHAGEGDQEETDMINALGPVIYWLVFFSIVVHGLSIPALNLIYRRLGVKPIQEDAVEIRRKSLLVATPANAITGDLDTFIAYNRFSRPVVDLPVLPGIQDTQPAPVNAGGEYPDCSDDELEKEEKKKPHRRTIRYMV
ncbi:Na-H-Exchanger domain-containing protein [Fusarium sp. LHS14.1]|nr:Na-H-Exchanger domain-containing protein [Fusarium sp. LHS14.1]